MSPQPSRPRDVVFAGVLTIVGSVLALGGIFSTQGELRSSSMRREVEAFLEEDQALGVDVSVDTALSAVEVALSLGALASVAAGVLAVFVLRRHNGSRIALTVLGGLVALPVLGAGLSGVFISVFMLYTVSLLWRPEVRAWFAGAGAGSPGAGSAAAVDPAPPPTTGQEKVMSSDDPHRQPPADGGDPQPGPYPQQWPPPSEASHQQPPPDQRPPDHPPRDQPPRDQPPPEQPPVRQQPSQGGPPAYPGYGQPGQQGYDYGQPSAPGYGQHPGYAYPPPGYYGPPVDPSRRPAPVVTAHVLTWVGAAVSLLVAVFLLVAASSQPILDVVGDQLAATGVDVGELVTILRIAGGLTAVWSVAVLVVSIFSWRRANWARVVLTVMGAAYLALQFFSLLTGQLAVIVVIAWVTLVIVLLWLPASREWYSAPRLSGGPPPAYPPSQQPGDQGHRGPW